jgi:hypothetical protein
MKMEIDEYRFMSIRKLLDCGIPLAANDLRQGLQMLVKEIGDRRITWDDMCITKNEKL